QWGTIPAPESLTVDVTPRRLQTFTVSRDTVYVYQVVRSSDRAIVQSGSTTPDSVGLLTIPGVKVYRTGSVLAISARGPAALLGVGDPGRGPLRLLPVRSPLRGAATLGVVWPRPGDAHVDLFDAGGRRVRVLFAGAVHDGPASVALSSAGIPSGIYFVQARIGSERAVRRVVVVN
ncbi:MAG TPA: hypothetical protein VI792_01335, partial [Candidatus Eisenbacteria bacterium]